MALSADNAIANETANIPTPVVEVRPHFLRATLSPWSTSISESRSWKKLDNRARVVDNRMA